MSPAFAVWITGRPASGKSTLARALARRLKASGLDPEILESDALRAILTPRPTYAEEERDRFYAALVHMGTLLVAHGVPVIFDATGHRRAYRERARQSIARFLEVHVDCPPEVCEARDPKGIYRMARAGQAAAVPGVQAPYEAPERADVTVRGDREDPEAASRRVEEALRARGFLGGPEPEDPGRRSNR